MNKKIITLTACLLVAAMLITGCAASNDLMKGVEPKDIGRIPKSMDKNVNEAVMNFTWEMFKESSQNPGNIMISSPSVYFALAMTLNGADKETKFAMLETLSAQGISVDELNEGLHDWMNYLMSDDRIANLTIANSLWLRDGFEANAEFLQKNADYYSASIKTLDFNDKSAPGSINKWVNDATDGTIEKIIDKINEDVMMYLINAIYFKSDWKYKFSASNTYKRTFSSPTGIVETDFMNRRGKIDYLESGGITGVILPYLDEQFAFVGILPKEGQTPRELIADLTSLDLIKLINNKKGKNIDLSLPKFESSYEDSLMDELSKLGMEIAFDPYNADFSLMKKDGNKDIYISEVKQKTYIRVDEEGTEAAAVTSIEATTASLPPEFPKVVFDRPFIYGIVDVTTGIPMFMGIMENPAVK